MKTAKRPVSILLSLLLLLSVCPVAYAAPAEEGASAPAAAVLPEQPSRAVTPAADGTDAVIQRERAGLQKTLPKSEHLTCIMHTAACGARETRSVSKLGHVDSNGEYRCDRCSAEVGSPQPQSNCACGKYHTGAFAWLIIFVHRIVYFFKNLFR